MKFIFPKNYKYRAKIFGFIDYVTAMIDLVIGIILFLMIHVFVKKISTQIYIFVVLFTPMILFTIFISDGENIVIYVIQIVKFIRRRGIYFYEKRH